MLERVNDPGDVTHVSQEIQALIAEPFHLSSRAEVHVGVSIGISMYPQHGEATPEAQLSQADAALFRAKDQGRNRIEMAGRLRRAIVENQLRVYYQPQVAIESARIIGAEALVRWMDPAEGLVSPADFIPVAEETGLIGAIGTWVLRETCRQGREWQQAGLPPFTLSVNVTSHQFRHGDLYASVSEVLAQTGFPAEWLGLEITDSALMSREREVEAVLRQLREHGVQIAIDDFGTGYSSLAYLKRFPLDVLKIDKRFVDDVPLDNDAAVIANTIIAMGHAMGLLVLAEGVETAEQMEFLRQRGCDAFRGSLHCWPVPAQELRALLQQQSSQG